jgi:hypothetical protein
MHVNGSWGPFFCSDAIFPEKGRFYGCINKAVSLPDQAKIDRLVPILPLDCAMQICRYLNRGGAIFQGIGRENNGKYRGWNNNRCFGETGNTIKSNRPLTGCGQMITCNTDGAIVVVRRIFMVVRYYHERGNQKKQNEKNCNALVPEHEAPFTM